MDGDLHSSKDECDVELRVAGNCVNLAHTGDVLELGTGNSAVERVSNGSAEIIQS